MRIVFAGPSLPPSARADWPGIDWRPPAAEGDVYRAARQGPAIVGLIDGYFESVPAVWHKEILWAISHGIAVFGSSSIGALRAAELARFGMVGVGAVYRYLLNPLRDDSDVALVHAPRELDYAGLSEAHVNVHFTLVRAVADGIVAPSWAHLLRNISHGIFYKERSWEVILARAATSGLPAPVIDRLRNWLQRNRVDQKRRDANLLVSTVLGWEGEQRPRPDWTFQHTFQWELAARRSSEGHSP